MPEASAALSCWARIHVVRGDTPRRFQFVDGEPARLVVGSDTSASLCIQAPEVAPRQLDVIWDGSHLWLEDALRLGRTFVGGQLLNEWTAVVGQAIVSFGMVRLWMVAAGHAPHGQAPDFAALERARLLDSHHEAYPRRRDTGRITIPPELLRLNGQGQR